MELILISDSKLKVMLTPDDMSQYSITCDTIDYDNTETRRAFWNILDEAKHKTGFDAASDRVFIQVYPSRNGGCEMYVTKIVQSQDITEFDDKRVSLKIRKINCSVYRFDCLDKLLRLCHQLKLNGYDDFSSAYSDDSGPYYYLSLSECENTYSFICEYCNAKMSPAAESYIYEHCKCICEKGAVDILSELD